MRLGCPYVAVLKDVDCNKKFASFVFLLSFCKATMHGSELPQPCHGYLQGGGGIMYGNVQVFGKNDTPNELRWLCTSNTKVGLPYDFVHF